MSGKVAEQISSMTRLRDALEFIATTGEPQKGVLQVGAGIARGAVTFEDGLVTGGRLTTGALSGKKAVEEMLRLEVVKLQLMPFMPARKSEQVWINLRHLIANEWSVDGLVTDRAPAPEEEQREFVRVERGPEQRDVSTMVEAAFSGEELSQLRAALHDSTEPTEEISKSDRESPFKATMEIPLVMLEQAMLQEETSIAASDDAFFDMEPKEQDAPPLTVPFAFRDMESDLQPEPSLASAADVPLAIEPEPAPAADVPLAIEPEPAPAADVSLAIEPEPAPAAEVTLAIEPEPAPPPIAFPSIDFGAEDTYTQLPAAVPEAPPAVPNHYAAPAPADAAVDVVQALAPTKPDEEYTAPTSLAEMLEAAADSPPLEVPPAAATPAPFGYPAIDFDAPEEESVPPPAVPQFGAEMPTVAFIPEPQPFVPEPQLFIAEPQPFVPGPQPQPFIAEPMRPTAAGFFEPPLNRKSNSSPVNTAPALTPLPTPIELESTISDAERWMRAQKAMSAPVEQQREQFEQTNESLHQPGFTPFENATAISREAPSRPAEFDKSQLESIATPSVEDKDYQPLIAMPEDGFGEARGKSDKGIIDRPSQHQHDMGSVKRAIRRNLRQPERVLMPIGFACLLLGIFILPGQMRKSMNTDNNEQLADAQVEMTIAEETKQELRYASTEADRPPAPPAAVGNAGTGIASSTADEPGQTVLLRDDTALNHARKLSEGHKWNRIAYVMYREYLKKHPKDFDVRIELIRYLMQSKQTKEAKQECVEALTSGPSVEQSGALSALYKSVQLMPMN